MPRRHNQKYLNERRSNRIRNHLSCRVIRPRDRMSIYDINDEENCTAEKRETGFSVEKPQNKSQSGNAVPVRIRWLAVNQLL